MYGPPPTPTPSPGMIGPLGVEYDVSAGPGSNCLQLLQKVLVSLIVKATGQDRESE